MAETAYVPRLRAEYDKSIRGQLTEKFGYANVMQVPRLDKVVLNMGIGEAVNDRKKAETAAADLSLIKRIIPHRYPFLFIDKVRDIVPHESGVGIKMVTCNEPHFQGHFPGRPVMPGILLIEGMAQTAGALCVRSQKMAKPKLVYFMTIDKAKFRKPVVPGDVVEYHLTKTARRRNMWWYKGEAMVAGSLVCEALVSAMLVMD